MSLFEVINDQTGPRIIQLSTFLQNRVGMLQGVFRVLEERSIHICAISILDAADHAVVRMVVDRPDTAKEALNRMGHEVFKAELLGVQLPIGKGINPRHILSALLMAEVNVDYLYPLIVRIDGDPVLAVHVDDLATATKVLRNRGLELIGQDEVIWDDEKV